MKGREVKRERAQAGRSHSPGVGVTTGTEAADGGGWRGREEVLASGDGGGEEVGEKKRSEGGIEGSGRSNEVVHRRRWRWVLRGGRDKR